MDTDSLTLPPITRIDLDAALGPALMEIDIPEHKRRIAHVLTLGVRPLSDLANKYRGAHVSIVGSGPSAAETVKNVPWQSYICTLNMSQCLLPASRKPKFAMMLDPGEWVAEYMEPDPEITYIFGTTLHPKVWARFLDAGVKPYFFIPHQDDVSFAEICAEYAAADLYIICGGTTVGLRSIYAMAGLGAAMLDLHGFDSCYAPGQTGLEEKPRLYAHYKPRTHHDATENSIVSREDGGEFVFRSNRAMARQVKGFWSIARGLRTIGVNADLIRDPEAGVFQPVDVLLRVWGDGAIPWMAWKDGSWDRRFVHAEAHKMEAKYGLARKWDYASDRDISPPPH